MMPSETTPLVLAESSAHVQPHLLRNASTSMDRATYPGVRQLASDRSGRCCHDGRTRPGGQALTDSPVEDPGDAARWWEAYCLAENDEADELRRRADSGDDHARRQLACWLACSPSLPSGTCSTPGMISGSGSWSSPSCSALPCRSSVRRPASCQGGSLSRAARRSRTGSAPGRRSRSRGSSARPACAPNSWCRRRGTHG
jgi:hypothetical protein